MKKIFLSISCFLLLSISLSARTVITNYENPEITAEDIIECFVEELNKPRYAYGIYDYDVYKTRDNQNNIWSVEVSDCSYEKGRETVWGEQVTIFVSNGYFSLKTFGGETQLSTIANGVVEAIDLNDEEESDKFYNNMIYDLHNFVEKSNKWLTKYNSDISHSIDISELYYISYFWLWGFNYGSFFELYDQAFFKITDDSIVPDISTLEGTDISDNEIYNLMKMANFTYSLEGNYLALDYNDTYPDSYNKVLRNLYYKIQYNKNKKEYYYLRLDLENKDTKEMEYIFIPLAQFFEEEELLTDELIKFITEKLGDNVYSQGLFEKYKQEKQEDLSQK